MSAKKAFGGAGASVNAILEECAVNDLAVERREHASTRAYAEELEAQLSAERSEHASTYGKLRHERQRASVFQAALYVTAALLGCAMAHVLGWVS